MKRHPDSKQAGQKQATHQKILDAAHSGFRRRGFDGAGIDGLARDAGVTSGAFYKHFASKADAFRESVALSVAEFRAAVEFYQREFGDAWLAEFAAFYLGEKRCCELGESCGLQSLTPEVARSDVATRAVFQAELAKATASFANGLSGEEGDSDTHRAWANMALLIGGVTLARAVQSPELADEIAESVRRAVIVDDSAGGDES